MTAPRPAQCRGPADHSGCKALGGGPGMRERRENPALPRTLARRRGRLLPSVYARRPPASRPGISGLLETLHWPKPTRRRCPRRRCGGLVRRRGICSSPNTVQFTPAAPGVLRRACANFPARASVTGACTARLPTNREPRLSRLPGGARTRRRRRRPRSDSAGRGTYRRREHPRFQGGEREVIATSSDAARSRSGRAAGPPPPVGGAGWWCAPEGWAAPVPGDFGKDGRGQVQDGAGFRRCLCS